MLLNAPRCPPRSFRGRNSFINAHNQQDVDLGWGPKADFTANSEGMLALLEAAIEAGAIGFLGKPNNIHRLIGARIPILGINVRAPGKSPASALPVRVD